MTVTEQAKTDDFNAKVATTPIAIVGMASIFPQARTTQDFWDNILQKIDCVIDVPASRWNVEDYYDPNPNTPDKTYCKRGGFIPDVEFNPMDFGLPPNILEVTDVSQLLSLVVAKEALEDAGYTTPGSNNGREFDRENAGVVLGVVGISSKIFTPLMSRLQYPVWEKVLRSSGISAEDTQKLVEKMKLAYIGWEENSFPGTIVNVIAGRIANRMDLGGINCVIDAACGSSLAAVRLAVEELISRRANVMITGGVDTDNSIGSYLCFSKTPAFSKGQKVRTFDAETDGMMVGEGLAMFVLKRLEDAERDGDRIYAVIRGVGASSDGRFKSIYAPRADGQAKAIRRAYAEAGFSPATVGLIEAHGTGTMAGDPVEVQSLRQVVGVEETKPNSIALGSIKSQIAHTKATAGAAGMMKAALALHHKILPATINVSRPNPKLELENSPIYINTETRPWIRSEGQPPRRAGISSFGFGGTNFHVVLEEYEKEHESAYRLNRVPHPIILHASNPSLLQDSCRTSLDQLKGENANNTFAEMVSSSNSQEIPVTSARLGFVAASAEEAAGLLQIAVDTLKDKSKEEVWEHPRGVFYRKTGIIPDGKVVALFAGQGSQYVNMGRELAVNFPTLRQVFGSVDQLFTEDGLNPLSEVIFPVPAFEQKDQDRQVETLQRTEHAQPAIGAFSVGVYKIFQQAGFTPDFVAGHSFGELTALWAGGVLSDQDYLKLAKARGKAMAPPADPNFDAGTMLAVKGDVQKLKDALKEFPEITLANHNSNDQVVLAGGKAEISKVQKALAEQGFSVIPLPVSAAFHTSLVGHAQKPFAKAIRSTTFRAPAVPVYSNNTGEPYPQDPDAIQKTLEGHVLKPVLFRDEIEAIYNQGGSIFVEFGPKNVLANLVKNILTGKPHLVISVNPNAKKDSDRQLREAAVQLRVAGLAMGNIDPFALPPKVVELKKKSPTTVMLNGGFYISEKTKSAFDKALNDGFKVQLPAGNHPGVLPASEQELPPPTKTTIVPDAPLNISSSSPVPVYSETEEVENLIMSTESSNNHPVGLENGLNQLYAHQNDTLKLHEQYLQNQTEYARTFAEIMKAGYGLFSNGHSSQQSVEQMARVLESIERSLSRFHDHQAETLRVHEQYLESQSEFTQTFLTLLQGMPAPQVPTKVTPKAAPAQPVTAPPPAPPVQSVQPKPLPLTNEVEAQPIASKGNGSQNQSATLSSPLPAPQASAPVVPASPAGTLNVESLTKALIDIVSEKTGYPAEMLELDMDMEADLGIDSIKRVEILGAMREIFPEIPKLDNDSFVELRTLGQIIQKMGSHLSQQPADSVKPGDTAPAPEPVQPVEPLPTSYAQAGSPDPEMVKKALLEVVSEKTGYPVEMLELDMDMEADLGIDSIKRVEILGAMRELYPEMPKVEADALAELRTLAQIIAHMEKKAGVSSAPDPSSPPPPPNNEGNLAEGKVHLKALPEPDRLGSSFSLDYVCLISDDGTSTTTLLADALIGRGYKVAVLSYPTSIVPEQASLPAGARRVVLPDLSEAALQSCIEQVTSEQGPIGTFIHLSPARSLQDKGFLTTASQDVLKQVFLLGKHLKTPLNKAANLGRSAFLTVTHLDGSFGLGQSDDFDPIEGGLFGLVKSLKLEWPGVFCRALDLGPDYGTDLAVDIILAELDDPDLGLTEVSYGSQGRTTLVVETPAQD